MSHPWLRLHVDFYHHPVVKLLSFEDQRHFVVILCLKGDGTLDKDISEPVRQRLIQNALGLDADNTEFAKRRLMEVGLIDNEWQPTSWDERQFKSDSSTERTRKYRENKKLRDARVTSQERHCDAPDTDTEADTETYTDKRKVLPNGNTKRKFKKPTIEEVTAYCEQRNNGIDAQRFIDHYETTGWIYGKSRTPMKDWKAAVRTWEGNNRERQQNGAYRQTGTPDPSAYTASGKLKRVEKESIAEAADRELQEFIARHRAKRSGGTSGLSLEGNGYDVRLPLGNTQR